MNIARNNGKLVRAICTLILLTLAPWRMASADDRPQVAIEFELVDENRNRTVPVRICLPDEKKPAPVILFSHGLGGSRHNGQYLVDEWTKHGYVCVNLQHPGSDEDVWRSGRLGDRIRKLTQAANARNLRERVRDVSFVIDQLAVLNAEASHALEGRLDLDKIGMSGHSFGAMTTMALAGSRIGVRGVRAENRIDAYLAMSPQMGGGAYSQSLTKIAQPVLVMTGTKDHSPIDPRVTPESRREVYRVLPGGDKYELVLDGANHFAFGDDLERTFRQHDPDHHRVIQKMSVVYWDAYLKSDRQAKTWLQSNQPQETNHMKPTDIWQWK
ncbi:MAG: dienelactone hydrolase [Planctomycetales bacterium]|nr:dienelactone hydrolase [Planctomycetales bacterium]